jgi:cytochrome P450
MTDPVQKTPRSGHAARTGVAFNFETAASHGPEYWDEIRELRSHGELVWVDSHGGFWAATSYELVRQVTQDWHTFSSAQGVSLPHPGPEILPYFMPIEADPPRQRVYRHNVNPFLAPNALVKLEAAIRGIADQLIDGFVERGSCDLVAEFARKLPGTVFFQLIIGEDGALLRQLEEWARALSFDPDRDRRYEAAANMRKWAAGVLRERESRSQIADVVDAVLHLGDGGETFEENDLWTGVTILAQGGIGTSAQLIGSTINILCEQPDLQQRVRDDLELVPRLLEEMLRMEPPVTVMFRTATRDVEIGGQQVEKGDKVGLMFSAANHDPTVFDHPEEVDIDREPNAHIAFGLGVHRCIGSNLARLQVRVAVEQLLTRLSPFRMPDGGRVEYFGGAQRGPAYLPLEFTPGPKVFQEVHA